jgi:MFS family permease
VRPHRRGGGVSSPAVTPLRRNRDFLLLWSGAGATLLGARASAIAYPLLVLWHTGSAAQAGLVGFAALLPNLVVQVHAGALVDRWDRRRLMIACDLGCVVAVGTVAATVLLGHLWVPYLMIAAFVEGSLTIFYRLAERAGIRHVVEPEQLPAALSGNEARSQAAGLLGQPAGSVLFTVSRWAPFLFASVAHLVSAFSLFLIRESFQDEHAEPSKTVHLEIADGLRWIWRKSFLRTVMTLVSGSNFLFQVLSLALLVIIKDSGGSPASIGILTAISGVGGVLGALSGAWWMHRVNVRRLVIGGLVAWAALIPMIALTSNVVLLGLIFSLAAYIGSVSNVAGGIYQVTITPGELQGRVTGVMGLLGQGANSLGLLVGGLLLDDFGSGRTVFGVAVVMMALAGVSLLLPPLDREPALEPASVPPSSSRPPQPTGRAMMNEWQPKVITPSSIGAKPAPEDLSKYLADTERLDAQLLEHKALVFRGFQVTPGTLEPVLDALLPARLAYLNGNSPRTKVGDNLYTSTDYPAGFTISMHNELSYADRWPSRLMFFCERTPASGGATPVVDGVQWLAALDPEVREAFAPGVRYTQNLHGGRGLGKSWQDTFETDNRAVAEAYLKETGAEWSWRPDGTLHISQLRPSVVRHPLTGAQVWFNQADQWHPAGLGDQTAADLAKLVPPEDMAQSVVFADGSPIPAQYVEQVRDRGLAAAVDVSWSEGDVLLIDNVAVAHGRRPYTGDRRILVAMA